MKKHFYYVMAFLLILIVSCVNDRIETDEDSTSRTPEAVWEYNGELAVLNKVIQELKSGPNREKLEEKLLKYDVLWEQSEFIFIDNKKRILVPFSSVDKKKVIGVLALVKDAKGKIMFDITERSQLMVKKNKLPFWDNEAWLGYFMALDKDILGIKNGSPGITTRTVKNNPKNTNAITKRLECGIIEEQIIFYKYSYVESPNGETSNFQLDIQIEYKYSTACWEVADDPIPSDPIEDPIEDPTEEPDPTPNINPNTDYNLPPSCQAFDYSNVANANWQAAATKNIVAIIGFYDIATGEFKTAPILFPQPIYFEMPIYSPSNGGYISPGKAAELTAEAIGAAIGRAKYYFSFTNASTSQVQAKLWEYIRDEMNNGSHIIGGKASFTPPLGFNGGIKDYESYWFLPDDCN